MTYAQLKSKNRRNMLWSCRTTKNKEFVDCYLSYQFLKIGLVIDCRYQCDYASFQKEPIQQYMTDKIIEKAFEMLSISKLSGFYTIEL